MVPYLFIGIGLGGIPREVFQRDQWLVLLDKTAHLLGAEEIVISGGGEPVLHPEARRLLSTLEALTRVHRRLYTNGSRLQHFPEIHLAFDYVRVSLDAGGARLYARMHGAPEAAYWRILEYVSEIAIRSPRTRVDVSMVVTSENCHSVNTLIADCVECGVHHILLKPLLQGTERTRVPREVQTAMHPDVSVENRCVQVPNEPIARDPLPLEAAAFTALIAPDGDFYPCCHLNADRWRISAAHVAALSATIGSDHYLAVLRNYSRSSHPCSNHDLWDVLALLRGKNASGHDRRLE